MSVFHETELKKLDLVVVCNTNIHSTAAKTRRDFLKKVESVKAIRSVFSSIGFHFDEAHKMNELEQIHDIVNNGFFGVDELFSYAHVFSIGIPCNLFKWLKNTSKATMYKQILNWHAAYCAFNGFEFADDCGMDPLILEEIKKISDIYYPESARRLWDIKAIDNLDDKEWGDGRTAGIDFYHSVSEKYTGAHPPSFLISPYRRPYSTVEDNKGWNVDERERFSIVVSFFRKDDWIQIIENGSDNTLHRSESSESMWSKWKHTFTNYDLRGEFVYNLLPEESKNSGFVYLIQTKSRSSTKIGWTNKSAHLRMAGIQTGNHEDLVPRGFFPASSIKTEKVLHEMFSDKRMRGNGEWFDLNENDIKNILKKEWRMENNIF